MRAQRLDVGVGANALSGTGTGVGAASDTGTDTGTDEGAASGANMEKAAASEADESEAYSPLAGYFPLDARQDAIAAGLPCDSQALIRQRCCEMSFAPARMRQGLWSCARMCGSCCEPVDSGSEIQRCDASPFPAFFPVHFGFASQALSPPLRSVTWRSGRYFSGAFGALP